MFDKFVLRRSEHGPALTLGDIAEALLYYQSVHLVLDYGTLSNLIDKMGMDMILGLLDLPGVSAVYCEETVATMTTQTGNLAKHGFVAFTMVGDKTDGTFSSRTERLAHLLRTKGLAAPKANKLAEKFRKKVPIKKLTDNSFVASGVIESARQDLRDSGYVLDAVRSVLRSEPNAAKFANGLSFEVISVDDGFHVFSNLDFASINASRREVNPQIDDLTNAHLVANILEARCDLALAAHYGGDFQTARKTSNVIRLRCADILRRTGIHREQLDSFEEIVLSEIPTVKDVVDSGERSFDEFLKFRRQAWRFRSWLRDVNPDEKLVKAYLDEVTREQWISNAPVRAARFVVGKLVDSIAPMSGEVLSVFDNFLLEKICKGWRPNHFVDDKLLPFVGVER